MANHGSSDTVTSVVRQINRLELHEPAGPPYINTCDTPHGILKCISSRGPTNASKQGSVVRYLTKFKENRWVTLVTIAIARLPW